MALDKKPHNIYLIDSEKVVKGFNLPENYSNSQIVESIMSKEDTYHIQELMEEIDTQNFNIILFFGKDPLRKSKLSTFCSSFVKNDQEVLQYYPTSASSVMFVWKNEKIFAITTGQGYRIIEKYSVTNFGLILATQYERYLKVTSLGSSEMSSVIHSLQTIYTTEVEFDSIQTLDTIFKEIGGRLNDENLVHSLLNLDGSSKKKSMKLKAKGYIQFGSSMDFTGLLHLLKEINELDISKEADGFNSIRKLTKKKDSDTICSLNERIIILMYEALSNNRKCPFELFHKDTSNYIFAEKYQVYTSCFEGKEEDDFDATQLLRNSFSMFLNGAEWTEDEFKNYIINASIRTIKDEKIVTDGAILSHISGEIEYMGKNYFVLDGEYYCQNQSYVDRLNDFLQKKLRNEIYTSEIETEWKASKNEDWFNKTVSQKEGYVQLHRQLVDNIEFADLIKYSNNTLTVVHVKDNFDGEMRVLDR